MPEKKKTPAGVFDMTVYGMMAAAVVYVLIQTILGNNDTLFFKLTLGVWMMAAVAIMDYVEPMAEHRFDTLKPDALRWYTAYAVADSFMYMCLYVFIINVSMVKEPVHYAFLALMLAALALRVFFFRRYRLTAGKKKDENVIHEIKDNQETQSDDSFKDDVREMIYRERDK